MNLYSAIYFDHDGMACHVEVWSRTEQTAKRWLKNWAKNKPINLDLKSIRVLEEG